MNHLMASIRIALRALKVNRLRSALTMLGIIIGVGAVIAMVGIGAGATERIEEQIQSIGSNLIIVLPGSDGHAFRYDFRQRCGSRCEAPVHRAD